MYLHRIHLNSRCREARRDLADPYQLHSTLCRAFSEPGTRCPENTFLWRLEPESDSARRPRILVQSRKIPDWAGITVRSWLAETEPAIDLRDRLQLDTLKTGQRFRFRLRANPCVTRDGKRLGLLRRDEQETWLMRKGDHHGFSLPRLVTFDLAGESQRGCDIWISQEMMLLGRQHSGNSIRIFSVLYDGFLTVTQPENFLEAIENGLGHGKAMGLGLLSVAPVG